MKVAAIQMVSTADVKLNLEAAESLLREAAAMGAELLVLPEYFCLMGHRDADKLAIAEEAGSGMLQERLSDLARSLQVWLVGGTIPLRTEVPNKVTNTCLVWSPGGEPVARYDKIHLFKFATDNEKYDESEVLLPGRNPVAFEVASRDGHQWRVGLSICYDLRFAELYRSIDAHGWLVPAAFTATTGQAHWDVLLRARAIETQCFVAASGQGGHHENGRATWGHSQIVDPWGRVLSVLPQGPGHAMADWDWTAMQDIRQRLPALQHRCSWDAPT